MNAVDRYAFHRCAHDSAFSRLTTGERLAVHRLQCHPAGGWAERQKLQINAAILPCLGQTPSRTEHPSERAAAARSMTYISDIDAKMTSNAFAPAG